MKSTNGAVLDFLDAIVDPDRPFLKAFRPFQARVAEQGIYNSLAQLLIKITAPGVPDFYQGTELWDLSLVDPDNRRPVDYARRATLLHDLTTAGDSDRGLARVPERWPHQAVHDDPRPAHAESHASRSTSSASTFRCGSSATATIRCSPSRGGTATGSP